MTRRDDHPDDGIHVRGYTPGDLALFRDIADAAAESAVSKMFVMMGHDPKNPQGAQADAAWTRRMRGYAEGAIGKMLLTAVGLSTLGALSAIWSGVKGALPR